MQKNRVPPLSIPALLVAAFLGPLAAPPAMAAGLVLKSVKVALPEGNLTFPGGKAADAINANCVTCHSAGMVLTQPNMPKAAWDMEVHKMINAFRAPIDPAAVQPIIDYLAGLKAPQ
ncbi:MAG: hypothetical protein KGJ41_06790 [Rhodospirillales bacterium]|nr:hypothetical protein [Rhodospirillales bacterium]MDE2198710.1 hypothetical protein [Rhodospirillales bacterium]MDE2574023.1 hypothetical protein [Rhodospirillales bacterium]